MRTFSVLSEKRKPAKKVPDKISSGQEQEQEL